MAQIQVSPENEVGDKMIESQITLVSQQICFSLLVLVLKDKFYTLKEIF